MAEWVTLVSQRSQFAGSTARSLTLNYKKKTIKISNIIHMYAKASKLHIANNQKMLCSKKETMSNFIQSKNKKIFQTLISVHQITLICQPTKVKIAIKLN